MVTRAARADTESDRVLPHNLDAERAVLASILVDNAAYAKAAPLVREASFYRLAHQLLFASLARQLERPHGLADPLTTQADLVRHGTLEDVGGMLYLSELLTGATRATNIAHYATLVAEAKQRREIIAAGQAMLAQAFDGDDVATLLADADSAIIKLRHGTGGALLHTSELGRQLSADLEYRFAHRGELLGVPTGFSTLDVHTGGWENGDLVVVAARPSIGKTSLVLKSAWTAAESHRRDGMQRRVAFFSLEMKKLQLMYRLMALLTGIPIKRLRGGGIPEHVTHEWAAVAQAQERMATMGLFIDDAADKPYVSTIRGKCRQMMADGGLDLVIIDYFQLMKGEPRKGGETNRSAELAAVSRELKLMAGELDVPVMLLSQLNRNSTIRDDPRPKLSDLRDTGALEQDADVIAFLHRKDHKNSGPTAFIIDKARNHDTADIWLTLDRQTTRFEEMPEGYTAPEPTAEEKAATKKAMIIARKRVTI